MQVDSSVASRFGMTFVRRSKPGSKQFISRLPLEDLKANDGQKSQTYRVLKVLTIIGCMAGLVFQARVIVGLFFSFSTVVSVTQKDLITLPVPGLTVCNSNSIKRKKLINYVYETKKVNVSKEIKNFKPKGQGKEAEQFVYNKYMKELLDDLVISKFVSLGPEVWEFLDWNFFKCSSDSETPDNPCVNMSKPITSAQTIGNCFTLFHVSTRSSTIAANLEGSAGYTHSPVMIGGDGEDLRVEMSQQPFQPDEVLRFKVDYSADEYTLLDETVYGTVTIHDPTVIPDTRKQRYPIYPGRYYEFYITEQFNSMLPPPYDTKCRNYSGEYQETYQSARIKKKLIHPFLDAPLSREDCMVGCLANYTLSSRCKCWPQELPFLANFGYHPAIDSTKWCDWDKLAKKFPMTNYALLFEECFSKAETECKTYCRTDCKILRYSYLVDEMEWPSQMRIDHSNATRKLQLESLRNCCSIVSIRYWSSEKNSNEYHAKYSTEEFLSYIGGLVGLWVGFSVLAIYDYVEAINEKVKEAKEVRKRKKLKEEDEHQQHLNPRGEGVGQQLGGKQSMVRKRLNERSFASPLRKGSRLQIPLTYDHNNTDPGAAHLDKFWYIPELAAKDRQGRIRLHGKLPGPVHDSYPQNQFYYKYD